MLCPRCQKPMRATLEQGPSGRVELDVCPLCRGIWFDSGELALLTQVGNSELFDLQSPLLEGDTPTVPCPRHPTQRMIERQLASARMGALASATESAAGAKPLRIDQCPRCSGLWFDSGELEQLVTALRDSRMAPFLVDPKIMNRPTSGLLWMFMFLTGLPVEQWQPRLRRPLAVLTLIALCVGVFFWQLISPNQESLVFEFGLIPDRLTMDNLVPLLTHMFLHGGLLHLLGNLYFLWVFGDNVEDRLGAARFVLLYFAAGLGAALCHVLLTNRTDIPVVGASGAIAGVMAAYAVLFPRARLVSLIFIFSVRWKTTTYLGIWLVYQVIGALMGTPGIAWWAHIGGFVIGAVIAWPFRLGIGRASSSDGSQGTLPPALRPASGGEPKKLEWY